MPQGTDLGSGLTQLDSPSGTVQGAAHELGQSAGATGAATVATGVPAAGDAAATPSPPRCRTPTRPSAR
ncbi:hypothetical protein ACFQ1I_27905 [Kitasatospora arboriphila]